MSYVPYASAIGSFMYAMVCTRLDIIHVVGYLSRYMSKPRNELIQMDLSGHPPIPMNHQFELVVLINHDIHPFGGEWNVVSSSFVNCIHHLMIS
jgi:hypothetical protein